MKDSDSDATPPLLACDRARALRAAQTEVERSLWQRLRNRQLNGAKFRGQHPIGSYIADFFCLDARLESSLMAVSMASSRSGKPTRVGRNTGEPGLLSAAFLERGGPE
jgi:hypothetical protein